MLINSWNIRGLCHPSKKEAIKRFTMRNNISIMVILETRLRDIGGVSTFGRDWTIDINHGYARNIRIVLLWKAEVVTVTVLERTDQCLHCYVVSKLGYYQGHISFVYARNVKEERSFLWNFLIQKSRVITEPSMVLGDFNVILHAGERSQESGTDRDPGAELGDFLMETGLANMPYTGCTFTWSNGHTNCKLDRVVANDAWMQRVGPVYVQFCTPGISDHSPSLVRFGDAPPSRRIPFRFKDLWSRDESFIELVTAAWATPIHGYTMHQVVGKLKVVKSSLKTLNLSKYSNLPQRVEEARVLMEEAQLAWDRDCANQSKLLAAKDSKESFLCLQNQLLSQMKQAAKLD